MIRCYIAGPISGSGNWFENARAGCLAWKELFDLGIDAVCPHWSVLQALVTDSPSWEEWLTYDEETVAQCEALLRLPGESRGADREVALANRLGIPVFYTVAALRDYWAAKYGLKVRHGS